MSDDAPRLAPDPDDAENGIAPVPGRSHQITRVMARVEPWFESAFERLAQEDVDWDLTLLQFPTAERGQFITVIGLFGSITGTVLGSRIMGSMQMQPYGLTQDAVDQVVRQFLESLRTSRSEQVAQMTADAEQAARNGHAPPTNGLFVPGR